MSAPTSTPRASVWEWTQMALLAANLAWTTLCLGGYLPETMVVTSALIGLLLAVHFAARAFGKNSLTRVHPAGWWLLPFLIYAAANVICVTPVRWLGWMECFGWAQMIAVFWVVLNGLRSPAPRVALLTVLATLGTVAVALACYQRLGRHDWMMLGREQADQFLGRSSGCFGIPNSLAAYLLLMLPAAGAAAWRRESPRWLRVCAGVLALLFSVGIVLTVSRGAWIALALALAGWPLLAGRGQWWRRVGGTATALLVALAIGTALYTASPLVRERFTQLVRDAGEKSRPMIWRVGWQLFREHPAVGTGAASYNVLFEKFRPEGFNLEPRWAHNDYLNTLSDYGVAGFVLFFGACGVVAWNCARRRRETTPVAAETSGARVSAAALAVGLAAFALQLFVDFHFKIPALAMTFAALAALAVQPCWPLPAPGGPRAPRARWADGVAALACAGAVAVFFVPRFRAEALRDRARYAIDHLDPNAPGAAGYRAVVPGARADLTRAVRIDPANAQAWADLAYAVSLATHAEPERLGDSAWLVTLGREAAMAADHALALTQVSGECYIRRGVARDLQGRWLEAGDDFAQALKLSPVNALAWYYYAYHLSLNNRDPSLTEAALAFCLRLDPGNSPGLALRQHLAITRSAP